MWKHIASNAFTFLVLTLFLLGGVYAWANRQYTGPGPLTEAICVEVPTASNFRRLAAQLQEKGAITSPALFRAGADYEDKAQLLKAGSFRVPEGASMQQIVDIVTRGGRNTCGTEVIYRVGVNSSEAQVRELDPASNRFVELARFDLGGEEVEIPEAYATLRDAADTNFRVAVAEGVTSWQIWNALSDVDILEHDADTAPPEGVLAPDSYEVRPGEAVSAVLARMQQRQAAILDEAWQNRTDGLPVETPEEALILASIIEKETGVPEERRQVASVFVNRLRQGMKLQTDPTVIYGITRGEGILGRGLRQSELQRETPWNTYVITGLPPTPIANPGRASIEAALDPDQTDYIFFVADGTGGHAFATTLREHNANVAKWREIEAERAATGNN